MKRSRRLSWRSASILLLSLFVVGCAGLASGGTSLHAGWIVLLALAVLAGCSAQNDDNHSSDAGWHLEEDAGADMPPPRDMRVMRDLDDSIWGPCCSGGQLETCFCESELVCNYVDYITCPANPAGVECAQEGQSCPGEVIDGPDADMDLPDADMQDMQDGVWEPCCLDGKVDSCFCEAGASCNYGWYEVCGGSVELECAVPGGCPPGVDLGTPDMGSSDMGM